MIEVGQRIGKLTVVSLGREPRPETKRKWKHVATCQCDCGRVTVANRGHLSKGTTSSCGCVRTLRAKGLNAKHGHATKGAMSKTYKAWLSMRNRCYYERDVGFPHYGGRGITVCERWRQSFANFLADMGEGVKGMSLDRIDVNGNYEPGNCRWATRAQQRENQRPFTPNLLCASVADLVWALASKIDAPLTISPSGTA